jgi:hypothetical protein
MIFYPTRFDLWFSPPKPKCLWRRTYDLDEGYRPENCDLMDCLTAARDAARAGANHTATLKRAKAGRAAYVNAGNLEGHIDPGAEAVARLFESLTNKESA